MQQAGNSVDMGTCKPWFGCPTTAQDKRLQNKWAICWIYWLHSGAEQLSVELHKNSAQWTQHDCTTEEHFYRVFHRYFLESMNHWFILPQMLTRANILNTCMTAAQDYLSKKLLPHYSTCLSNKVPNWTCPRPMRRDTGGMSGVEVSTSKKMLSHAFE